MANLKLDQELLIHSIGRAGDEAIERIRGKVEEAREEAIEIAKILPEIRGLEHSDIFLKARVAVAKTMELGHDARSPQLQVNLNGAFSFYSNLDDTIPAGKYRALFFLVPVKE